MSKTCCVFHSCDLDGWMSAAIVKKWYNENKKVVCDTCGQYQDSNHIGSTQCCGSTASYTPIEFLGWDYGDAIPDLSEYDKVIMVDVSFPKDIMGQLAFERSHNFIWIDHHTSAIKENNFVTDKDCKEDVLVEGLRDINFAACELTWKYFFPYLRSDNNSPFAGMPEIVRLLGRYDCFGHKGTDEEQKVLEFQYGARSCINGYEQAYLALCENEEHWYKILQGGKLIYQYLCTEAKQTYSKAFEIYFPIQHTEVISRKFLCVNQERFNPINFGIDYHKDGYDGFACFWYKDGKWNWSLYNDNEEVDCSIIAKQYGGGGHKGASGFVCNNETFLKIIN